MQAIRNILCVIDPTAESQFALQRATWFAQLCDAHLVVLHCFYDEFLHGHRLLGADVFDAVKDRDMREHEQHLEKLVAPIHAKGISCESIVVWDHPLHEGITRYAVSREVDIVFKDTHSHPIFGVGRLSNTDWSLMRECPVPLWFVKPLALADKLRFIAAIDPFSPDDESADLDRDILDLGSRISDLCGGELHAVHAFDARVPATRAASSASLSIEEAEDKIRQSLLSTVRDISRAAEVTADNTHVVMGSAHSQLPIISKQLGATAVIMGAISRNRLERLFIGATAELTLDRLPCDLVVVRPSWAATMSPSTN